MGSAISEFRGVVDEVYGVYLDSTHGFRLNLKEFDRIRAGSLRRMPGRSHEQLDGARLFYDVGDPNTPEAYPLHVCTQAEYRRRNEEHERNDRIIGNLCIVLIYQYWEDYYRGRIAREMGIRKDDLKVPVMGDLRLLRKSIIHHRAIALPEVKRCEVTCWFREGDLIAVDRKQFEQIVFA